MEARLHLLDAPLGDPKTALGIAVTDLQNRAPFVYYSATVDIGYDGYKRIGTADELMNALLATTSVPGLFGAQQARYSDGGILRNQPALIANTLLRASGAGSRRIYVLRVQSPTRISTPPRGLADLSSTLVHLWTSMSLDVEIELINMMIRAEIAYADTSAKRQTARSDHVFVVDPQDPFPDVGFLAFGKDVERLIAAGRRDAQHFWECQLSR
jgi:predicted acylesterase/phospholipase RssA